MSISAYQSTVQQIGTPQEAERQVIAKATALLKQAAREFDGGDGVGKMTQVVRDAVWKNQQMWMLFKADLISEGNDLQAETKANLINIALFVDRKSKELYKGEGKIMPLVDLNLSVMGAIRGPEVERV
jgi:flagellar protein FlaF